MKQTLFMIATTAIGTVGVLFIGPFAGLAVYYLFAVLRPQYLWEWALPPDIAWSSYVAVAAIVGAVLMSLGTLPIGGEQRPRPGFSPTHRAYLLFGSWVSFTYVTAQNQDVAWVWLMEYLKIFTMFGVATYVIRSVRQVWCLYVIAAFALIYIAYEVNILYLLDGRIDIFHRGYGGLDNNGAGLMLAMGVPLAIYGWEATRAHWRWIFAAGTPVLVHAVLMTYSRGAMLSLLLTAPMLALRSRRRWQFAAMAVLMACVVPILAGPEIRERFLSVENYHSDESANSRFQSWQAAIQIANEHPIVGVGIRNSNLFSEAFGADMEGRTIHSQYLQTLADNGYVGLAFYLMALGSTWFVLAGARRTLKRRLDADALLMRSMLNGLEGAMAVFCVGSFFLSLEVFELPYLLALLAGETALFARREPSDVPAHAAAPQLALVTAAYPVSLQTGTFAQKLSR